MKLTTFKNKAKYIPFFPTIGGYDIPQPSGLRSEFTGVGALGYILSRFFLFVLPIAGILGFLFFLWSGFQFLMSKGDPKALEGAKQRLTYAIIGLVIIFLAWALLQYFRGLFGLGTPTGPGGPGGGPI